MRHPRETPLLKTARNVNNTKPAFIVEQLAAMASRHESPVIGCLGLTYKADVDDLRESPSLDIVRQLIQRNVGEVIACDPYVHQRNCDDIPTHFAGERAAAKRYPGSVDGSSSLS